MATEEIVFNFLTPVILCRTKQNKKKTNEINKK